MNIDQIILQIRSLCPVFNGNVAGAAAFERAIQDQTWLNFPAAYVYPEEESVSDNTDATGLYQIIHERIGIIVAADNTEDRRGQNAVTPYRRYRNALFRAILNWRPDWKDGRDRDDDLGAVNLKGIYYVGFHPVEFDRGRLFMKFIFGLDVLITEQDGWQDNGTPLYEVDAHYTDLKRGSEYHETRFLYKQPREA